MKLYLSSVVVGKTKELLSNLHKDRLVSLLLLIVVVFRKKKDGIV
jgi:hypothetical protein